MKNGFFFSLVLPQSKKEAKKKRAVDCSPRDGMGLLYFPVLFLLIYGRWLFPGIANLGIYL